MAEVDRRLSVDVTMLGSFSVRSGDGEIGDSNSHSRKLFGVLGYLICNRGRMVRQSELIDQLWDSEGDANPANALKTLLYRIRRMLEPLFPDGTEAITSSRGGYGWSNQIECRVDLDQFRILCARCADVNRPAVERIGDGRAALDLYRGEFMDKMGQQLWVIPISVRLHDLYIETAKLCAHLLEQQGEFAQVEELAGRAIAVDALRDDLYVILIRALLNQGKDNEALDQYGIATELLYRSLGVRPSEELQQIYRKLMDSQHAMETDLEVIQGELRETARRAGAFSCEYGIFREIYRLESRRSERSGACIHVGLLTVTRPDGLVPEPKILADTMDRLREVLAVGLRRGDVMAKYSAGQYVVLLPGANFEDSTMVMERAMTTFRTRFRAIRLKISYKVWALT